MVKSSVKREDEVMENAAVILANQSRSIGLNMEKLTCHVKRISISKTIIRGRAKEHYG